jgi:alkyl sulfatase BDS1-like metallo-beta-lactamase superfamily hydrolase
VASNVVVSVEISPSVDERTEKPSERSRAPRRTPGVRLHTSRPVLDGLLSGELRLDEAQSRGQVRLEGDAATWAAFTALLDDFSADFPVVTRP